MKKTSAALLLLCMVAGAPAFAQDEMDNGGEMFAAEFPSAEEVLAMSGSDGDVMFIATPGTMGQFAPPPPAVAQMHRGGFPDRGGSPFADLNLTDDQYEKMFALKKESIGKMAPKMGEIAVAQMQLKDLMLQPELDRSKVQAVQDRINSVKTDIANTKLQQKMAFIALLTPEQRKSMRLHMIKGGGGSGCTAGYGRGKECPVVSRECPVINK